MVSTVRIVTRLDDWCESFAEIDARMLRETMHNLVGFIAIERAIWVEFVFENPFAEDDVGAGRTIDKSPCSIGLQSAELKFHGGVPVGIPECGTNRRRQG